MLRGISSASTPSVGTTDGTGFVPDIFLDTGLESLGVCVDLRGAPEPGLQLPVEDRVQDTAPVLGNPIDHPPALPNVLDKVRVPEDPELVGDPGLLHFQDEDELANAEVPLHEEQDKPKARRVREGLEHFEGVFHFDLTSIYEHIFIYYAGSFVKRSGLRYEPGRKDVINTCVYRQARLQDL
jgi:hypothetical protein